MQQVLLKSQSDFSNLQTFTPQLDSFSAKNSFSLQSSKKMSFSDFVQEAKKTYEKPAESSAVKKDDSSKATSSELEKNEQIALSEEKSEKKENLEKQKTDFLEKSEKKVDVKEKSAKKTAKNVDFSEKTEKKVQNISNNSKESKNVSEKFKITEKKSKNDNFKEIKNKKSEDEISELNLKNIPEDVSENAFVLSSENLKVSNEDSKLNFSDIDFDEISETDETEALELKSVKTYSLDKDKKILVKDFRTENSDETKNVELKKDEKSTLKISEIRYDGKNSAEITMDVQTNVQQNLTSSTDQAASSNGSNFQAMLQNQIQQNASEIVKAGTIVLKDNNVGQIKLILHPESLGNVKIDLNLNDKNISGRIVVSSQEAFNAFKESAESLKQAFSQSGFNASGLELSLANQSSSGNGSNFAQENQNAAQRFAFLKTFGEVEEDSNFLDSNFSEEEIISKSLRNSVNIVA